METGFVQKIENGLRVCVDWLAFTFPNCDDVEEVLSFLGFTRAEFQTMPRGLNGYMKQLKHASDIKILYDGNNGMGVHVIVPGSAIHTALEAYQNGRMEPTPFGSLAIDVSDFDTTIIREFLGEVVKRGNVTRLDLAIDDIGAHYYSIESVIDQLQNGDYSSKFKGFQVLCSHKSGTNGYTVYLGSRQSSCMVRIYDKQAEQNSKFKSSGAPLIETPWIRWELELKHINAHQSAVSLSNGKTVSSLAVGLLSNYFRFINHDDVNVSRCSSTDTWRSFCSDIEKFSVYVPTPPKTIDDVKRWLNRQVAPSLAKVVISDSGDMSTIYNMIDIGSLRLSSHDVSVLNQLQETMV